MSTVLHGPSVARITLEEYLNTSYRPDCEFVDGELQERNLGEQDHSRPQTKILYYVGPREAEWGLRFLTEQRVQVTKTRYRVPDTCAVLASEPFEPIITKPPFLCIEILSKDDRMNRTIVRLDDFLKMGVANIWVIDPMTRRGYRYSATGLEEATDGVLRSTNPAISMPLAAIFE